jgi:hypothetical protein
MKRIWELSDLIRTMKRRLRFGSLSRLPLNVLRLELRAAEVECDWAIRAADPWDADLGSMERERKISEQALRDAMSMREILFSSMPELEAGVLRVFRYWAVQQEPELLIQGEVNRSTEYVFRVDSLVMRAKLHGFQFQLNHGILQPLQMESNFSFQHSSTESQHERRTNLCQQ